MSQKYEKLKTLLKGAVPARPARSGLRPLPDHARQERRGDAVPRQGPAAAGEGRHSASTRRPTRRRSRRNWPRPSSRRRSLGADPETLPKVKDLRAKLARTTPSISAALESEVYDHLFSFFRRYYSEGDFLAKRVYRPGVYAIPYEGEEVTLHWANKDQYYIKTSEYLRDYAFRLRPDDAARTRCACTSGWWMPPRASTATSRPPRARTACSFWPRGDFIEDFIGESRTASWSSASSTARRRSPTGRR
jgi:adenine-specific DNA-methyltransferase